MTLESALSGDSEELTPKYPATASEQACLEWARQAVRGIERFAYRQVGCADGPNVKPASNLLRTAIGLRRMLDNWKIAGGN